MKKEKVVALFVELKSAFDSVNREMLLKTMRQRVIREGLVKRVVKVMREMRSRVMVGGRGERGFLDSKGMRQGCPLYPLLFNLLIANMEGEMEKVRWGAIEFGGRKEYSYADDVVLLAEEEDEMKSIIKRLEGYLEKKRFKLNLKKTKVMRKGRSRMGKRE